MQNGGAMTDREALLALAIPEPEIRWDSRFRANTESVEEWDAWNRSRLTALKHARRVAEDGPSSP